MTFWSLLSFCFGISCEGTAMLHTDLNSQFSFFCLRMLKIRQLVIRTVRTVAYDDHKSGVVASFP